MHKTRTIDSHVKRYAYIDVSQIYKETGTSSNGLTNEQVEQSKKKYGSNSFSAHKKDNTGSRNIFSITRTQEYIRQ